MYHMISFIVPVYNAEAYLQKCVDSLRAQKAEIEIILVNDGSKDASGALCDQYASEDSRIRVIHKENGGISSARNAGMEISKGDYIWFVDSDDWLEPDAAEVLLKTADATGADITAYGMIIDYMDQNISVHVSQTDTKLYRGKDEIPQAILSLDKQTLFPYSVNKLYRSSFLKRIGAKFPATRGPIEDIVFQLTYIAKAESIAMVDRDFYHYVQFNTQSMVHRYFDGLFEINQSVNTLRREFYRKLGLTSEEAKKICAQHCILQLMHSIKNLYRRSTPEVKALRREVWKQIISDPLIKDDVQRCKASLTEAKLLSIALCTHSAALANAFFATLMYARVHLEPVYKQLRVKLFLKRQ